MGNKKLIISQIKQLKSLRAAAAATGNRSEFRQCSELLDILSVKLSWGGV